VRPATLMAGMGVAEVTALAVGGPGDPAAVLDGWCLLSRGRGRPEWEDRGDRCGGDRYGRAGLAVALAGLAGPPGEHDPTSRAAEGLADASDQALGAHVLQDER